MAEEEQGPVVEQTPAQQAKEAADKALQELNTAQKLWKTEPEGPYVQEKDTDLQYLPLNEAKPIIEAYQEVAEASKAYVGQLNLQLNGLEKESETEKASVLDEIAKYSEQGAKANRHLAECLANCLNNGQYDLLVAKSDGEVTPPPSPEGVAAPAKGLVNTKLVAEKIKEHVEAAKQCQKDASDAVKRLEKLKREKEREYTRLHPTVLGLELQLLADSPAFVVPRDGPDGNPSQQASYIINTIQGQLVAAQQNLNEAKLAYTETKKQPGVFKADVKKAIKTQKQGLNDVLNLMEGELKQNLAQQLQSEYQEVGELVEIASADRTEAGKPEAVADVAEVPASPSLSNLAGILKDTKEERLGLQDQSAEVGGTTGVQNRIEAHDALIKVLNEYEDKILKHITQANYDKAIAKLEKNLDSSPMVTFYRFAEYVSTKEESKTKWREKAAAARMRGMVKEIRKNIKEVVPGEGAGDTGRGLTHTIRIPKRLNRRWKGIPLTK